MLAAWLTLVVALDADGQTRMPADHERQAPDYRAEVLAALRGVRMPPPPTVGDGPKPAAATTPWGHHDRHAPDYLAAVRPDPLPAVAVPAPPPGRPPAVVRGIYLNAWVFGSDRFYDLVRLADTTEINAFVIDVKDATGYLTYRSSVPTAVQIGANQKARTRNPRERLALLHERGIHPIARIVVARDPLLAERRQEWAIMDSQGGVWHDGLGEPWVDAHETGVWEYAAALAAEATLLGFAEIQFDYVRFPDEPAARLDRTVYRAREQGESRRQAIRRNVTVLRDRVRALGVPFTLDVFGLTTSATGDLGIGQHWDDLSELADVLLPMVYPSHYGRGSYGIAFPNAEPYAVVRRALLDGVSRSEGLRRPAKIRPYLQAFSLRPPRYTAEHVREQIEAVKDVGLTDWVLWNARGVYPAAAFQRVPALPTPAPRAASTQTTR